MNTDRALWITWYDLPATNRDSYFAWLHASYIPQVLARPGVLWGAHYLAEVDATYAGAKNRLKRTTDNSVPGGTRFMLLFGAEEAHVFVNPAPAQLHATLPDQGRSMLGMRRGVRSAIVVEQARVEGPEAMRFNEPAPCIQLGSYNAGGYEEEDELADWYAQWYLASCANVPGCVRARKFVSASGWAKHAVLFEFESLDARNGAFLKREAAYPQRAAWTDRIVRRLIHAPGSPAVARRIWPALP